MPALPNYLSILRTIYSRFQGDDTVRYHPVTGFSPEMRCCRLGARPVRCLYSTVDTLIRYTYVVGTVLTHMGHRYVSLHAILNGGKAAAPLPYVGESLKNASPERAPVGVLSPQRQYTEDVARLSKRSLGTVGPASLRFHRGCGVNHVIFIGSESEKVRGEKRDGEMPHICGCHSIFSGGSLTSFPGSVRSTAPFGRGRTARKQPGAAGGIRDNEDHNDVGMQENEVDACQFRRQKKNKNS